MKDSIAKIIPLSGHKQGEESFKLEFTSGKEKIITTWDYAAIYSFPNLYRKIYCDLLDYKCFEALCELLLKYAAAEFQTLRVLDVACGSGLMGKAIKSRSSVTVKTLVGVDILPEAITALKRDAPDVYQDAFTVANESKFSRLNQYNFNVMSICGGASHITLEDLQKYLDAMANKAYIVFHLLPKGKDGRREKILEYFEQQLSFCESKMYNHRKLVNGNRVQHEAFLFQKTTS